MPKVSVVMAVRNGGKYLEDAVNSILSQTFRDFEFIIIDDASTDNTSEYLRSLSGSCITIMVNSENLGLTKSLNMGVHMASGEYIARIDADDISYPTRLEKQAKFLDMRPEVGLLGTYCNVINETGCIKNSGGHLCTSNIDISRMLLVDNYFAHCSTMFRRDMFLAIGGYSEKYRYAQDYELWTQFALRGLVVKFPEWLVAWRELPDGLTATKRDKQTYAAARIAVAYMREKMLWLCDIEDEVLFDFRRKHKGKFRQWVENGGSNYEQYFKDALRHG
jgi:glycosyltransferase involved in cell wall biosynthesis